MTTYLAAEAERQLDEAQMMLDQHVKRFNGYCRVCGVQDCFDYLQASAVFARYQRLPLRRPYASIM
jgi:hypothetical protein